MYCDIETDGLVFECTRIHCATIFNATEKEWVIFAPEDFISNLTESQLVSIKKKANRDTGSLVRLCPVSQLPVELSKATKIVMHNGIKFDLPMINKIFGCDIPHSKVIDTLILSTISRPDRLGGHSLKSWGERLNEYKGESPQEWDKFTFEMLIYNIQDVHVTVRVHEYLKDELDSEYDKKVGVRWKSAVQLEHECAAIIYDSEIRGFPFDAVFAESVLNEINDRLEEIDNQLGEVLTHRIVYQTDMLTTEQYDEHVAKSLIKHKYPDTYRISNSSFEGKRPKPNFDIFTAKGGHNKNIINYFGDDYYQVAGPFTKVGFEKTDADSVNQMKEFLLKEGWKPTEFTEKGSPQITEESLVELSGIKPSLSLITERYQLKHRRGLLLGKDDSNKGLLNNIRADGRITPYNNSYDGVTGRSRHRVIVNIPNIDSIYGPQFRKMFTSGDAVNKEEWYFETYRRNKDWTVKKDEEGNKLKIKVSTFKDALVGCDASGLELRLLAHLLNNDEFTAEVLNGDVHTKFWSLIDNYISSRGKGKGVTYGFLYGAGDSKLGSMCDIDVARLAITETMLLGKGWNKVGDDAYITKSMAKRDLAPVNLFTAQSSIIGANIREAYLKGIPSLNDLVNELKDNTKRHGFLIGVDGRRLTSRSSHSALNLMIQSTGAIVMKRAMQIANSKFRNKGVTFGLVTFMHDEFQIIVKPKYIDFAKEAMIQSIIEAGQYYDLNCPLDGEAKVGVTWLHTH